MSYHIGLCHYLKDVYPDDVVIYHPKYAYYHDGCGRFCLHLRSMLWLNEDYYNSPAYDGYSSEFFAESSEWFIKRTGSYGFAAKGGNNEEHHNNNDVGCFIFSKSGKQIITDLGAGVYSRQYFNSKTRYDILECSSRSHSVPIIDGHLQFFGKDAIASDTKFENGVFSTEFAAAYKCEGLESIKRAFSFTEERVILRDVFVYHGKGDIVERLVSLEKPKYENGILSVADTVIDFDHSYCELELGEESSNQNTCYFMDFKLKAGVREFTCEIG